MVYTSNKRKRKPINSHETNPEYSSFDALHYSIICLFGGQNFLIAISPRRRLHSACPLISRSIRVVCVCCANTVLTMYKVAIYVWALNPKLYASYLMHITYKSTSHCDNPTNSIREKSKTNTWIDRHASWGFANEIEMQSFGSIVWIARSHVFCVRIAFVRYDYESITRAA